MNFTEEELVNLARKIVAQLNIKTIDDIPGSPMSKSAVFAQSMEALQAQLDHTNAQRLAAYVRDVENARRVYRQGKRKSHVQDVPLVQKLVNVDYENFTYETTFGPEVLLDPPLTLPWDEPEPPPPPKPSTGHIAIGRPIYPGNPALGFMDDGSNVPAGTESVKDGITVYFKPNPGIAPSVWFPHKWWLQS